MLFGGRECHVRSNAAVDVALCTYIALKVNISPNSE